LELPLTEAHVTQTADQREAERLRTDLDQLEQQTDTAAQQVRARFRRQVEALDADLAPFARKERSDEFHAQAKKEMTAAREEYDRRLAELAGRARTSAFGSAPASSDGASIIAFRDAEDRAERLQHRDEAAAAMRRSLETGDRTMVKAIARKAHTRGWADVATMGADVDLLREVSRLEGLSSRQGRRRDQRRLFRWSV
jgi:DNA repair exonuclease SbcCD ATPase subunit